MTSRDNAADVIVIGGGIIGCAAARALAAEGLRVVVLERSRVAAEASGAAAGYLAAHVHATAGPMLTLASASLAEFPSLVAELREETGLDVEFTRSGVYDLAFDEEHEERLRDQVRWLGELGHEVAWHDRNTVLAAEPAVSRDARGGLFDADTYHVNPPRLTTAFAQSAGRRGVQFRLGLDVVGIEGYGARATTVHTTAGPVYGDRVVIAAGAWSNRCGEWLGVNIPVVPAKGQILTVSAIPAPMRAVILGLGAYLLPRLDGTVVVGATVEDAGYDKATTAGAIRWLLTALAGLCPALADAPIDRIWAGLRPGTPDELPIIGRAPGWENVVIATGHFRNGILLTPVTTRIVADLVLRGTTDVEGAREIDPARFAEA